MYFSKKFLIGVTIASCLLLSLFTGIRKKEMSIIEGSELIIDDLSSELLTCYLKSDFIYKKYILCLDENWVTKGTSNECVPP